MEENKEVKLNAEQVKEKVKGKNFYLTVFDYLKKGKQPKDIRYELSISKQYLNHYLKDAVQIGLVKRIGYGVWELTDKGKEQKEWEDIVKKVKEKVKSLGTIKDFYANLHALQIEMPILEGNLDLIEDFDGYTQEKLKGWQPQYKRILSPIGFTIKNNNNKSVSIYIFSREIPRNFDITPLIMRTSMYVYKILLDKQVKIDIMQAQVKNLHISVRNDDLDRVFNNGEKFEVLLNRDCAKIFESDESREARAWYDASPYKGVETNDIKYKENLIMQPERIERIDENTNVIKKEITENKGNLDRMEKILEKQLQLSDNILQIQINNLGMEENSLFKKKELDPNQKTVSEYNYFG